MFAKFKLKKSTKDVCLEEEKDLESIRNNFISEEYPTAYIILAYCPNYKEPFYTTYSDKKIYACYGRFDCFLVKELQVNEGTPVRRLTGKDAGQVSFLQMDENGLFKIVETNDIGNEYELSDSSNSATEVMIAEKYDIRNNGFIKFYAIKNHVEELNKASRNNAFSLAEYNERVRITMQNAFEEEQQ